jgi:hypothetical protein
MKEASGQKTPRPTGRNERRRREATCLRIYAHDRETLRYPAAIAASTTPARCSPLSSIHCRFSSWMSQASM